MTEDQLISHPWYKWLERRFGDTVAARIINETHAHAIKVHTAGQPNAEERRMAIKKFEGYKGLFTEFWGFGLYELEDLAGCTPEQAKTLLGEFWDQPVVMVDDVHTPWLLVGHTGKDITMNEAHGFKCVDLVAESFTSRLYLASDVDALVARSFGSADQYHFVQEGA